MYAKGSLKGTNSSVSLRLRVQNRRKKWNSRLISELLHTLNSSLRDHLFMLQNEVFRTT